MQAPIPPARGFHAGPGEIPFECRPRVGFPREPLDEFRLARRRGSERSGGAVLRLLMRRRGVGQPLLQRGVRDSVFRYGRVVPGLKRGELRPRRRQFRGVPPVGILPRSFGGGQLPFKAQASVRFLSEPVFERRLTRGGRGQILCGALHCVLLRRLRFGQRAFERGPRGIRFCQSSAKLRFHAGELPGGRGGFRCALPTRLARGRTRLRPSAARMRRGRRRVPPARRRIAPEVPRAPRGPCQLRRVTHGPPPDARPQRQ